MIPGLSRTLRALCAARLLSALDATSKAHTARQHPKQAGENVSTAAADPLEAVGSFLEGLLTTRGVHLDPPHADNAEETARVTWQALQALLAACETAGAAPCVVL